MRIVGISGSLRKASTNTGLLRYVKTLSSEMNFDFEILDISQLPLMNEDLEVDGQPPQVVVPFREAVKQADAVIFACPEYNYGVTPAMKNAVDWASRWTVGNVWDRKPGAIMGSGGGFGTGRSQLALRQSFIYVNVLPLNKPEVCIRRWSDPAPFNEEGDLVGEKEQGEVKSLVEALLQWTKTIQAGSQ